MKSILHIKFQEFKKKESIEKISFKSVSLSKDEFELEELKSIKDLELNNKLEILDRKIELVLDGKLEIPGSLSVEEYIDYLILIYCEDYEDIQAENLIHNYELRLV